MTMNRRDFITQASLLAVGSSGILQRVRAAENEVVAETAFGRVRGVDVQIGRAHV